MEVFIYIFEIGGGGDSQNKMTLTNFGNAALKWGDY